MIPTLTDIDEYVMENSAAAALQEMRDDGFYVSSIHVLHARIRHLNAAGVRRHVARIDFGGLDYHGYDASRENAKKGCNALLKAQIAVDQVMPEPMRAWCRRHVSC